MNPRQRMGLTGIGLLTLAATGTKNSWQSALGGPCGVENGWIPPTINHRVPDPDCRIDTCRTRPAPAQFGLRRRPRPRAAGTTCHRRSGATPKGGTSCSYGRLPASR
jgi:hypothetical protein